MSKQKNQKNHWFMTRPKRKLILVPDVLRVFMAVAQGEKWRANRKLHVMFEVALEENAIKGVGQRRDGTGGGGRTYAAWLFALGLFFYDNNGRVWPTLAGEALLRNELPVPTLSNQLLKFQYPSPYSKTIKLNERFKLFPYRFILKLLVHQSLNGYLTDKEVGLFASTLGETDDDLDKVVEAIEIYRNLGSSDNNISAILGDGWERTYTNRGNIQELDDIGNTFFNNLEITGFIERVSKPVPGVRICDDSIDTVKRILKDKVQLNRRYDEQEVFQRHFGLGINDQKDLRKLSEEKVVTHHDAQAKKVVWTYYSLLSSLPFLKLESSTYEQISTMTAVPIQQVRTIISGLGAVPSFDTFEQRYLELSMSGREGAKAFEQATAGIFGEYGLGLTTEWIGYRPNSPDVVVVSPAKEFGGILDAKAYKEYNLPGDHQRRMFVVYVPTYRDDLDSKGVPLKFFGYVAGGYSNTIEKGIRKISKESNINGFAITAKELINLVKKHKTNPYTSQELLNFFTDNERVTVELHS